MQVTHQPLHRAGGSPARWLSAALLGGLARFAWLITAQRMQGMDAGPGTPLGGLGFFVGIWVVMMAAMMLPSALPMVNVYAGLQRTRGESGGETAHGAVAAFVAGYLLSWAAAGLLAYALFKLGQAIAPPAFDWDRGGPYLAGAVILAAAAYQLTPLKDTCLTHCRSPLAFAIHHWRDGRSGALMMGARHGGWCVGCCAALMAVLFAVGVMSIGWMLFVAALVAAEKLLPWKRAASIGIAVVLVVLGLAVAFAPSSVPGLTQPDSAGGLGHMGSMERM
jgi:predicted metal-binding membrane protein